MGRKRQNPEESVKRLLILKMAGKMFMQQGYSAVSMDALAEAVPVSKRTLYNHFKDKKALFSAVMQSRCQQVFDQVERALSEDNDVEQTLTLLGKQFLGVVFEPDAVNIYRTAITGARQFPELGALFYEMGPKRSTGILANYFKRIHSKGVLCVPNPELAANTFLGMLINRMQMKCLLGLKKRVSAREKDQIIKYAVAVFLNGHKS